MKEFKGTKGKWNTSKGMAFISIESEGSQIAVLSGSNKEHNAQLISKAPEMLTALKLIKVWHDNGLSMDAFPIEKVNSLIDEIEKV